MCLGTRNPPGWRCCPSYWRILTTTPSLMPSPSTCSMEHIRLASWDPSSTSIPSVYVRIGMFLIRYWYSLPHALPFTYQWNISGKPLGIRPPHPFRLHAHWNVSDQVLALRTPHPAFPHIQWNISGKPLGISPPHLFRLGVHWNMSDQVLTLPTLRPTCPHI